MSGQRKNRSGKRERERLFEIGAYWLGFEAESEFVFYYWYDAAARRTRRKTTGERDLEKAKLWLAKQVLGEPPKEPLQGEAVTLAAVRHFYFRHHVRPDGGRTGVRDARAIKRAFALLVVYLMRWQRNNGIEGAPKVGHFSLALQEGFIKWCRDEHKLSGKTISTYMSYIKAGLRFAATPRLVRDVGGREREARLLATAPFVIDSEEKISRITGLPRSKPRSWIPNDQELAGTLGHIKDEWTFRYCVMALNTWARPEAICELSAQAQVRFDVGLVDMNPPGRTQNKKHRPMIRLTDNLRGWLLHWNLDRPIVRYGRPVKAVSNRTLQKAAKAAGVTEWKRFTRYALRHYMNTRVRRVPGVSVTREDRAQWIGHADPQHRMTEFFYESMDPEYLEEVRRAVDVVMETLSALCLKSLVAPGAVPGSRLAVLEGASETDSKRDVS